MKQLQNIRQNQAGMISITITVVFIMVISLTVLGFSQVSRKNSKEALDRQLSSQAFYAAEVGANDVRNKVANLEESNQPVPSQTDCKGSYTINDGEVDAANGVRYTCVFVDANPPNIHESNVGSGSVVMPLNASVGVLGEPTLKWKPSTDAAGRKVADCKKPKTDGSQPWTNFPKSADWNSCPFGLLRIDLTRNDTDTVSKGVDAAIAKTMTIFIYPAAGNVGTPQKINYYKDPVAKTGVQQGLVVPASCSDSECSLQLAGLDFQKAYMRVRSIYANTQQFAINAQTAPVGGAPLYTFDAQVEIDSTGRAQDTAKRIKVRISRTGGSSRTDLAGFSDFALQTSDSICKQFISSPVIGKDQSSCSNPTD